MQHRITKLNGPYNLPLNVFTASRGSCKNLYFIRYKAYRYQPYIDPYRPETLQTPFSTVFMSDVTEELEPNRSWKATKKIPDAFKNPTTKNISNVEPATKISHTMFFMLNYIQKVKVGNDQEIAQSERNSHSNNRDGKRTNDRMEHA